MSKLDEVKSSLFSVGGTNRHHTNKHDLEPGQRVEFRGSGAIIGVEFVGFANDKNIPTRVYRITADELEIL